MRATRKIWLILIDNEEKGPYSIDELKKDRRLTPHTLVRRVGSKRWRPIGKVKELRAVFEDEVDHKILHTKPPLLQGGPEGAVLTTSDPDGPVMLLVFIILLLVVWVVYNLLLQK